MKNLFFFLLTVVLFNSCESETEPIVFQTQTIEEPYRADITATFDQVKGNGNLSEKFNQNIEKGILSAINNGENKNTLKEALKSFDEEYKSFIADFSETDPKWELHVETEITYKSDEIITLAISSYEFKGGAHGNDKINFLNLNAKTGAIIDQKELLKDVNNFKYLAKEHFIKSIQADDNGLSMEDYFFGKPFQLPENIGLSDDGLILLYNVYEVASYDQGYTEFLIPFEDVLPYLNFN
ncbi:DUF3298 and DUF4163 domain-containing protein [Winogradskyella ursingii]|uniref:DUF3298 and DUF4163 domain-containing protein n=1 Tax=Winogradskyella ursingii TaxID=2686079 RepID=UPI001C53A494|nr:DUF3298 and DUF4163 domain-containing protein [Winogradskyella ursingii]